MGLLIYGIVSAVSNGGVNIDVFMVSLIASLSLSTLYIAAVWGMAIRKSWGRWLGVAGIAILTIATAVAQTSRFVASLEGATSARLISGISIAFLFVGGLFFLLMRLAFAERVDEFFGSKRSAAQIDSQPPPPPTFES